MKKFIFFLLLSSSWAIKEPKTPAVPIAPESQEDKAPMKKVKKKLFISVRVHWLGKNTRTIKGVFSPKKPTLAIKHILNESNYELEIPWTEIKRIRLKKWLGDANENGQTYFFPNTYELILKDGKSLQVIQNLSEINQIDLSNQYGKTRLYSYFVDFWDGKKWHNSNESDKHFPLTNPPKEVFQEIEFLGV